MNSLSHSIAKLDETKPARFSRWVGNFTQRADNRGCIGRPDQAGDFPAVFHENQSRPECYSEGTAKPSPFAIFDLDMADGRVLGKGRGNLGLSSTAVTAPGRAKLYDNRAFQRIDLRTQRF
jgi:hypothetical protein